MCMSLRVCLHVGLFQLGERHVPGYLCKALARGVGGWGVFHFLAADKQQGGQDVWRETDSVSSINLSCAHKFRSDSFVSCGSQCFSPPGFQQGFHGRATVQRETDAVSRINSQCAHKFRSDHLIHAYHFGFIVFVPENHQNQ